MMRSLLRLLAIVMVSALLLSCRGSHDSVDVQGTWSGTSDSFFVASGPAYGAFQRDGYGFVYVPANPDTVATDGAFITFHPISDASGFQVLSEIVYDGDDFDFTETTNGSGTADSLKLLVNEDPGNPRREMECIDIGAAVPGPCLELDLTRSDPFSGTPALMPGIWQGYFLHSAFSTVPSVTLDVQGNGIFAGTDSNGCDYTGTLSQIETGKNLFSVKLDSSCTDATGAPHEYTGLGYLSDTDISGQFGHTSGKYFYFGVNQGGLASPTGFALFGQFKVQ